MYDENILSGSEMLELLENAPENIFFKDTECKYRFVTELCSSVHGANRLGGNAVADFVVFGRIAGAQAAEYVG